MMLRTNIQNMPLNEKMERMTGIEPASRAWKARVLPLNHIRKILVGKSFPTFLVGTTGSFCEKRSCGSFCHKLNFEMTISKLHRTVGSIPPRSSHIILKTCQRSQRFWSGRQESNLRHLAPKASALPDCATSRNSFYILSQISKAI